jgi:uncharacterized Rmd1/YagE family protein
MCYNVNVIVNTCEGDAMHWLFILLIVVVVIYGLAAINMRMAARNLVG